jgi:F-type H+-transporting ATPase subunit b
LLQTVVLAAAEGGERNPLIPPVGEIVFSALAFLVLYWLMARFVFPRVNTMLEERARNIQGKLEEAERDRQEARALRERYQQQIDQAQDEADQILAEARQRGEEARRDIIARAEQEAERRIARAEEQIRVERDRAIGEVRRDVGLLAVQLAERIVGEQMNGERQQRMVDRFVDELAGTQTPAPAGGDGGGRA